MRDAVGKDATTIRSHEGSAVEVRANGTSPVTVIVPTFNRASFIAQSIASVLGQTRPPAQVIVVDDGSTDDTPTALEPYRDRIEYLRKENGGKSSALNLALRHVREPNIWVFDDDDIALPDAVERHLAALDEHRDAGFSYGGFRKLRLEGGRWRVGQTLFEFDRVPQSETFVTLLLGCSMAQQGMIVRRRCYEEVGPFDEALIRAQDYEMLLRLSKRYRGVKVDGATFYLRVHSGSRGGTLDRHSGERREALWYKYEKNVFRRLAGSLPLEAYLPNDIPGGISVDENRRRALFQRAAMLARRGLWDAALGDLQSIQAIGASAPLSSAEADLCTAVMDLPLPIEEFLSDRSRLNDVIKLFSSPDIDRSIRLYLARGLYRCAVAVLKEGRYVAATRFAAAFMAMIGFSGLGGAVSLAVQRRPLSRQG